MCRLTCRHRLRFRCGDAEASATGLGQEPTCEHRKRFLFVPETLDSAGRLYQGRTADHHDAQPAAANSCSGGNEWLVAEGFDVVTRDLHTWLGTLCVLLWLLFVHFTNNL